MRRGSGRLWSCCGSGVWMVSSRLSVEEVGLTRGVEGGFAYGHRTRGEWAHRCRKGRRSRATPGAGRGSGLHRGCVNEGFTNGHVDVVQGVQDVGIHKNDALRSGPRDEDRNATEDVLATPRVVGEVTAVAGTTLAALDVRGRRQCKGILAYEATTIWSLRSGKLGDYTELRGPEDVTEILSE